jgi:hypothetical protein
MNVSEEPTASMFRIYNPEDQKYVLIGFFYFPHGLRMSPLVPAPDDR